MISWYQKNKRILPWRETYDPYKIWLSEVILQQTRVVQGLPYYQRFVEKYPCIHALAEAKEQEILRLWQGLGYYSRARNLYTCAQMIVNEFNGKFPTNYKELLHLKGVGTYTAAAIASIAFKEAVPVVHGNVYRVLASVFGIQENIASTQGIKVFHEFAKTSIPQKKADLYNQAIMEFGAMHCTPVHPKCNTCMFKRQCVAFHFDKQNVLPVKNKMMKIRKRSFNYFIIQFENKFYMKMRQANDIWKSLYDFYLLEDNQLKQINHLERGLLTLIKRYKLAIEKNSQLYKHILTQKAQFLLKEQNLIPFTLEEIKQLPKPILINNFLKKELLYINYIFN